MLSIPLFWLKEDVSAEQRRNFRQLCGLRVIDSAQAVYVGSRSHPERLTIDAATTLLNGFIDSVEAMIAIRRPCAHRFYCAAQSMVDAGAGLRC